MTDTTINADITVAELARRRSDGSAPTVLDVREAEELATARIPEVLHVPMDEIPARIGELPKDAELAVMCHGGGRSGQVARYLRTQGFANVRNVTGGIDAWSKEIDPTVPRY